MKSLRAVATAVAFAGCASVALAQHGNGSDYSGPANSSLAGGAFVPLPSAKGKGAAPAGGSAAASIKAIARAYSNGTPTSSPVTGQPIPAAALKAVGNLLTDGSPANMASVGSALTAGGAPSDAVGSITNALSSLAGATDAGARAAIVDAAKSYNSLVRSVPASFLAKPPGDFLAIQAALAGMVASLPR